jgi:hypothetical protein
MGSKVMQRTHFSTRPIRRVLVAASHGQHNFPGNLQSMLNFSKCILVIKALTKVFTGPAGLSDE